LGINEREYDMICYKSFADSVKDNGITTAFPQILSVPSVPYQLYPSSYRCRFGKE